MINDTTNDHIIIIIIIIIIVVIIINIQISLSDLWAFLASYRSRDGFNQQDDTKQYSILYHTIL